MRRRLAIALTLIVSSALGSSSRAEDVDRVEIEQWLEAAPEQVASELREAMKALHGELLNQELAGSSSEAAEIRRLLIRVHEQLALVAEAQGASDRVRGHYDQILALDPGYAARGGMLAAKFEGRAGADRGPSWEYEIESTKGLLEHHPRVVAIEGQAFRVFVRGDELTEVTLVFCAAGNCRDRRSIHQGKRLQRKMSDAPILGAAERVADSTAIISRAGVWAIEVPGERITGDRFSYQIDGLAGEAVGTPTHIVQVVDDLRDFEVWNGFGPRARAAAETWRMRFWPRGATELSPEYDAFEADNPRVFRRDRLDEAFQ